MADLRIINNTLSTEERITARVDAFRREIMRGDGDVAYINEILEICLDYVAEYEHDDLYMASIKIKESIFYIDNFIHC